MQRVTETFLDAQKSGRRIRAARDRLAAAVAQARDEVAVELADDYRVLHGYLISALLSAAEAHELVREAGAKAREVGVRLPHQPLVPPALASMLDNATPHSRDGARAEGPMARLLGDARRHGYSVNDHPMKYSTLKCRPRAA